MFISSELDRASAALDVMLHALKYYQAEPVTKHQQPNQFIPIQQKQATAAMSSLTQWVVGLWHPSVLDHRWIDVVLKIPTLPCSRFVARRPDPWVEDGEFRQLHWGYEQFLIQQGILLAPQYGCVMQFFLSFMWPKLWWSWIPRLTSDCDLQRLIVSHERVRHPTYQFF